MYILIKISKSVKIAVTAISITLLTVIFLLTIIKSSTFNVKEISRPSTISSNDEKNLKSGGNTASSIKNSKSAVPGKTQARDRGNTSESLREVHGIGDGKTIEEHLKGFSSMDNDAKINLIINLESLEPDLLNLAFSDKSADVRIAAAKSLFWIDTDQKNILPFITLAMNDESSLLRDESCKLMDSLNDKGDVLSLMEPAMNSAFSDVRLKAVSKFIDTDIPKENVKPLVMKALSDKDKKVRTQALLSASFLWDQEFGSEDEAIIHLRRE